MSEINAEIESPVVVLLTEQPVEGADAERILALHEGEQLTYRVLVPADTKRSVLTEVVDALSLAHWREAAEALREGSHRDPELARAEASTVVETTVAALRALGRDVDGVVTDDDPVPALEAAVEQYGAREVVVVTRPHAVEETFHRDWASRAREVLGVPVLHTYAGTGGQLG
ncbi:hypothetical protein SAMN06264364_11254 [Quadrisphaera granulorum]|uniref:Universal stress protein family protein n=1 Tax=Quadrisphaera granulorum TaxID=317664 RepID=A0A316A9E2_9ACTN|nr:hypothetical protein [Quadrisphaera granulorum]PWJ53484.1 hypothetical protein BXY45_11254 [Quadrisphaera granulorum]SZE96826.1 hypothetical protein SAMN06264364_11254 [Quadrisphaera granulorum]